VAVSELTEADGDRAAVKGIDAEVVKRFGVKEEGAFSFFVGAGLQLRPLVLQEPRQDSAGGLALLLTLFESLAGDIVAQANSGENVFCRRAGPRQRQRVDCTERLAPVLGTDLVLHDVGARTAGANSHAEAGQVVVEEGAIDDAGGQRQSANCGG